MKSVKSAEHFQSDAHRGERDRLTIGRRTAARRRAAPLP